MYYVKKCHAFNFFLADSALNHVKQRLQFLRPPPKIDLPTHGTQQSSSSDVIDLTTSECSFESMSNDNGASTLGVDKNVSGNT